MRWDRSSSRPSSLVPHPSHGVSHPRLVLPQTLHGVPHPFVREVPARPIDGGEQPEDPSQICKPLDLLKTKVAPALPYHRPVGIEIHFGDVGSRSSPPCRLPVKDHEPRGVRGQGPGASPDPDLTPHPWPLTPGDAEVLSHEIAVDEGAGHPVAEALH